MVDVQADKGLRVVLFSIAGYLYFILCDILSFLLQNGLNISGGTGSYRYQQHLEGSRCSTPITFYINKLCMSARRRSNKELVAGVGHCCLVRGTTHIALAGF